MAALIARLTEALVGHAQLENHHREALQGALINLSLILGIPILRSLNLPETAAGQ